MRSRDFSLRHPLIADRRWLGLAVALLLLTASTAPAHLFMTQDWTLSQL